MNTMKFTECLNDLWDYFFLGDPVNISKFQSIHNLSNDLIHELTMREEGDQIVEEGVLIPLSGIANYPYHVFFQTGNAESVFSVQDADLQFEKTGYILEVIHEEIYLMTLPYLKDWTNDGGIQSLKTNNIRPRVPLENGWYHVTIKGGETNQRDKGWEPTLEFILTKSEENPVSSVEDVNFSFHIDSKEY